MTVMSNVSYWRTDRREDSRVCEEVVETDVREEGGGGEKDRVKKPAIQ